MVSVTIRTYPDLPVIAASLNVTTSLTHIDNYWTALEEFHRHIPSINDAGGAGYYFMMPVQADNAISVFSAALFFANKTEADLADVDAVWEPMVSALNAIPNAKAEYASIPIPSMKYLVNLLLPSDADSTGFTMAIGSRLVSRDFLISSDGPKKLVDALSQLKQMPGRSHTGHIVAGGAVASNAGKVDSALNPAWRRAITHITYGYSWPSTAPPEEVAEVHRTITYVDGPLLRELEPDMGAYPNEADAYEPEFQKSFWGDNYWRLRLVKRKWDPKGLFIVRSGVGSEDWDEEGMCRK